MQIAKKILVLLTLTGLVFGGALSFAKRTPEGSPVSGPIKIEAVANCEGQDDCTPPTAANVNLSENTTESYAEFVARTLRGEKPPEKGSKEAGQ